MKRIQCRVTIIALLFLLATLGQAYGAVSMYLVYDEDAENEFMDITSSLFGAVTPGTTLQYDLDNDGLWADWDLVDGLTEIDVTTRRIISFRLDVNGTIDNDGFIKWGAKEEIVDGLQTYSNAIIGWGGFTFQMISSGTEHNFATPAPTPSALLLLGTGLFALVGLRRHGINQ